MPPNRESYERVLRRKLTALSRRTDYLFAILFVVQLVGAVITSTVLSPLTWAGQVSSWHIHLLGTLLVGCPATVAPIVMARLYPGRVATRITVSICQAVFTGLLIHLSGGRIETHFHVFGSLAFLAFYRDWRVLVPYTAIVAADHLARSLFWPESVFGVMVSSPFRALEHVAWVTFEDVFLVWSCITGRREMRRSAEAEVGLIAAQHATEDVVLERTRELQEQTIELEEALKEGREMSHQLAQAQKLESIGQLAAGIAHEINTPMQFVNDNTRYVQESIQQLFGLIDSLQSQLGDSSTAGTPQSCSLQISNDLEQLGYGTLREEVPDALAESIDGIERVVGIVRSMKEFSHPGAADKTYTDLNQAIRSTSTISRNRWKYIAELSLDLAPDLPPAYVLPAEVNQVLLNLIVNSADAIGEKLGDNPPGLGSITVRTWSEGNSAFIEVVDDGPGIPQEIIDRVFDPFFTTKQVGKGTGQGLAICHDVVVNKHQGELTVESPPGEGARFLIRLPIQSPAQSADMGHQSQSALTL